MNPIKTILEELVSTEVRKALGYAAQEYSDKNIDLALNKIADEIIKLKQDTKRLYESNEHWRIGYNQAISDIARLIRGKE